MSVDPERMTREALVSLVYDLQSQVEALLESRPASQVMEIQTVFKLTSMEAKIVSALLDGRPHSKESIYNAVYFDSMRDPPEMKIIDVMVCKIRKKMFPFGVKIETIWGSGYHLTDCARVLSILNGEVSVELIAGNAAPIHRKHGENEKSVLSVLVAEMNADGKTKIGSRVLARKAGLKGSLLPIMARLAESGAILVKSQPTRGNRLAPWIVHVKARAL
ncbi:helix-turn-helix domain-containing protein [Rhizobium azibense]|uniref:Transcriptional regulator n=1 Tax=Rhizobium azibense TaxID=1136135 RepID=A0A4R3RI09_9HYPH|nr:helix-turn-helix domain-containing protein [Rhizobium azibense]TCU34067.1 transcriptional regulator [Rhizobium azibense]